MRFYPSFLHYGWLDVASTKTHGFGFCGGFISASFSKVSNLFSRDLHKTMVPCSCYLNFKYKSPD